MRFFLNVMTATSAIILILIILLQNQGSGLGSAFGDEGTFYRSKRGMERGLFVMTIVLSIIFVASIIASLILT